MHLHQGVATSVALCASVALADTTTTFSSGTEGWTGAGFINNGAGNPGACFQTFNTAFGMEVRNSSNLDFIGDYSDSTSVTLRIDVKVNDIVFFGSQVSRPWLLDLRNADLAQGGYPWTSVWFKFGDISQSTTGDWTTFEVTIDDPTATDLPPGWSGYGDETGVGEPILPPGVTFADVLAGVTEVAFTTFEPGFAFGFTDFDVLVDNIEIVNSGGAVCDTDVDGSGSTDVDDLVSVIVNWGICVGCPEDVNGDNRVDVDDLVEVILNWGPCPQPE